MNRKKLFDTKPENKMIDRQKLNANSGLPSLDFNPIDDES